MRRACRISAGAATKASPVTDLAPAPERELAVRTARRDGREVVTLRCVARDGEIVVECDVYPISGLRVEPLHPGPYTFDRRDEAEMFVDEAVRALTVLGCDVG